MNIKGGKKKSKNQSNRLINLALLNKYKNNLTKSKPLSQSWFKEQPRSKEQELEQKRKEEEKERIEEQKELKILQALQKKEDDNLKEIRESAFSIKPISLTKQSNSEILNLVLFINTNLK